MSRFVLMQKLRFKCNKTGLYNFLQKPVLLFLFYTWSLLFFHFLFSCFPVDFYFCISIFNFHISVFFYFLFVIPIFNFICAFISCFYFFMLNVSVFSIFSFGNMVIDYFAGFTINSIFCVSIYINTNWLFSFFIYDYTTCCIFYYSYVFTRSRSI